MSIGSSCLINMAFNHSLYNTMTLFIYWFFLLNFMRNGVIFRNIVNKLSATF
jgi:hypothetical protein